LFFNNEIHYIAIVKERTLILIFLNMTIRNKADFRGGRLKVCDEHLNYREKYVITYSNASILQTFFKNTLIF